MLLALLLAALTTLQARGEPAGPAAAPSTAASDPATPDPLPAAPAGTAPALVDLPRVTIHLAADGSGEVDGKPFHLHRKGPVPLGELLGRVATRHPDHVAWIRADPDCAAADREEARSKARGAGFPAVALQVGDGPPTVTMAAGFAARVGELPPGTVLLGSLPKADIDAVIKKSMSQVRDCFKRGLERNRNLAGRVTIKFVIAADGRVSSASVKETTVKDPSVGACIAERFEGFVFPEPNGGGIVTVSYPFIFTPG